MFIPPFTFINDGEGTRFEYKSFVNNSSILFFIRTCIRVCLKPIHATTSFSFELDCHGQASAKNSDFYSIHRGCEWREDEENIQIELTLKLTSGHGGARKWLEIELSQFSIRFLWLLMGFTFHTSWVVLVSLSDRYWVVIGEIVVVLLLVSEVHQQSACKL